MKIVNRLSENSGPPVVIKLLLSEHYTFRLIYRRRYNNHLLTSPTSKYLNFRLRAHFLT